MSGRLVLGTVLLLVCVSAHVHFQRSHLEEDHPRKDTSQHLQQCKDGEKCAPCPAGSSCVPKVACPSLVRPGAKSELCHVTPARTGVCCSTGQNHTTAEEAKARSAVKFDERALQDATSKSKLKLKKLAEEERRMIADERHNVTVSRGKPAFGHFQSQRTIESDKALSLNEKAFENLFTMQTLKERQNIEAEDVSLGLARASVADASCPPRPTCDDKFRYRTVDGTCNNPLHPTWGAARTATERLLPPNYDDGIWSPRKSAAGKHVPLKSARFVSGKLLPDKDRRHSFANLFAMQFGQFITHDVSNSVTLTFKDGKPISCCSEDGSFELPKNMQHFGCFPIDTSGDEFYSQFRQTCMNFVRTQLAPDHECAMGYAKQMNGVTHFLDLSQVYGSDPTALETLREFSGGRMKMFDDFGRDLLPLSEDKNDCITMQQGSACFKSGDGHANQMLSLVAVHMIFTREHNRVAGALAKINPHWSDEVLFLEARRITIAEFQHVIYAEYLPLIIGEKTAAEFQLKPKPSEQYSFDYDVHANPSLTNEFGVAAFRFGHSTVDGHLEVPNAEGLEEKIAIPEVMFHPARMRVKDFFDRLLIGLTSQPMQETDPSMTKMLTKYMFRGGQPFGLDLASLNIQRGVDHGLRGYNDYRQLVGLPRIEHFREFGDKVGEHLSQAYAHVDDIDLWIGGLLEAPEDGAAVGFTFKEIIADQFSRFKRGDRYFYEHGPSVNPGHLAPAQLAEIKKVTMARLICDNSDRIELHAQSPNAFVKRDAPGNQPVDCLNPTIPFVDLNQWKDLII